MRDFHDKNLFICRTKVLGYNTTEPQKMKIPS